METVEKVCNMFQVNIKDAIDVVLVSVLLTLNLFHKFF